MSGNADLRLRSTVRGSTVEVAVAGDLDMAAAFRLETKLDALLAANEVKAVVLDLSDVPFMDSAGLGALLAVRDRTQQLNVDLNIPRVSDGVRRILDVTGLSGIADP